MRRFHTFATEKFGPDGPKVVGNISFGLFIAGILAFAVVAALYRPEDPFLHPSSKLTSFLTSSSNATFRTEPSIARTGEDFPVSSPALALHPILNITDVAPSNCDGTIDCTDEALSHSMMRAAIERFPDMHFYRFGKPVRGDDDGNSCDMAWRFRPADATNAAFYKDYRRFVIARGANCSYVVASIGEYHSGTNVRRRRKKKTVVDSPAAEATDRAIQVVGEVANDTLPVVESEAKFSSAKYLLYSGGGDRCKNMNQYLWSFLCSLGEARYLNRTLVMDLSICLNGMYTASKHDEEGKDFRFYFDLQRLMATAAVVDQNQFWTDWGKWHKKDGLGLYFVDDYKVTPMQLAGVQDTLIMRGFGKAEPENYWYHVCEGETESVIQRPWESIWKSPRLMGIVSAIADKLSWDFDALHVVRGEKAKNTALWPNLEADTSPDSLLLTLQEKGVEEGRRIYIATNEKDRSLFDPLKGKYEVYLLDDLKELWGEGSEWYVETKELNNGNPVEFDGYMRVEVDTEVFLRGKKKLETFNDLTSDCKDGVNTCNISS